MEFMTQIERRLWNYLSPRKKAEVRAHLDALNKDEQPDAQQPDTQKHIAGSGMGFRRNAQ